MTLQEFRGKINSRDFFLSAVILLVGFVSFGLGRLSKLHEAREGVFIAPPLPSSAALGQAEVINLGGQLVASKTGAKYHYPWCAGALAIAEKNKRWFATVAEARAAGYAPASNCKGLQ